MLRKLLAAGLGLALGGVGLAAAVVSTAPSAGATTAPDFSICPSVGADTGGCQTVVVINPGGSLTIVTNTAANSGPYDSQEDSLVGVQNDSGQSVNSIALSSTGIFAFDSDGICTKTPFVGDNYCSSLPPSATGYEGPNTSFTVTDTSDGTVNFTNGLADQATTFFSLEEAIESPIQANPVTATTTVGFSGQVADFTDSDPSALPADYSATINWGDGSTPDAGSIGGTAPNFTVSGTHTFASTVSETVQVTIVDTDNSSNQAVVSSTFTVEAACTAGQPCTTTASQTGVQTDQVSTTNGGNVSVSQGTDASLTCAGTSKPDSITTTLTSSGATGSKPKVVTTTLDQSIVNGAPASTFHICYTGATGFTSLGGTFVPAGGTGILPFCVNLSGVGPRNNPPPCLVSSTLVNGNVVLVFHAPAGDPHYGAVAGTAPTVSSISPTSGSHAGGTLVTIKGANFKLVQKVLFGTTAGTAVKVISATEITVVAPAHLAGAVDVRVQASAGTSKIVTGDKFQYV